MKEKQNNNLTERPKPASGVDVAPLPAADPEKFKFGINTITTGKYADFKDRPFRELIGQIVTPKIQQQEEEKQALLVRMVNQNFWITTGVNLLFRQDIYNRDVAFNNEQEDRKAAAAGRSTKEYPLRDVTQLYHVESKVDPNKHEFGWASFLNSQLFDKWNGGPSRAGSLNPTDPDSEENTLEFFFRNVEIKKDKDGNAFMILDVGSIKATLAASLVKLNRGTTKDNITVDQLVKLIKSKDVQDSIKTAKDAAADPDVEEEPEEDAPETPPEAPRAAASVKYNIYRPKKRGGVLSFQSKLRNFYEKNKETKNIAAKFQADKLKDGRYGYRTHAVSRAAIDNLIKQLKDLMAKKPPAVKESRLEKLSEVINKRLTESQTNWLFEQPEEGRVDYKFLLTKLQRLKSGFDGAYAGDNRAGAKGSAIDSALVKELEGVLGQLQFDAEGNIINLPKLAKDAAPDAPATPEATPKAPEAQPKVPQAEKPKKVPQKRHRQTTCRFAINLGSRGQQMATPDSVFIGGPASWTETYSMLKDIFASEISTFAYDKSSNPERKRQSTIFSNIDNTKTETWNLVCLKTYLENMLVILQGDKAMYQDALQRLAENKKLANYKQYSQPQEKHLVPTIASLEYAIDNINGIIRKIIVAAARASAKKPNDPTVQKNVAKVAAVAGDKGLATVKKVAQKIAQKPAPKKGQPKTPAASPTGPQAAGKPIDAGDAMLVANAIIKDAIRKLDQGQGTQAKTYVRGLVAGGATRKDYLTKNPKVSSELLDAALDYIKNDPAGKAQLGRAVFGESLKQRREKLLSEALFKKLV